MNSHLKEIYEKLCDERDPITGGKRINWRRFYEKFLPAIKEDYVLTRLPNLLWNRFNTKITKWDRFKETVFDIFTPLALVILRMLIYPLQRYIFNLKYMNRYNNINTIDNLIKNGIRVDYIAILTYVDACPTILPIIKSLDRLGKKIAIITTKEVYNIIEKDVTDLKNSVFIFLIEEAKMLNLTEYILACKRAKSQYNLLISKIKDKNLLHLFKYEKRFLHLSLKIQNIQNKVFEKIISYLKPKAIISMNFTAAFYSARKYNITRIMMQHGLQWDNVPSVWPDCADIFISWGKMWKENFRKNMGDTVKIVPLGNPRFDYINKIKNNKNILRSNIYNKLKLNKNKKNVIYIHCGGDYYEKEESFLIALSRLVEELGNEINLILKQHPREDPKIYDVKKEARRLWKKEIYNKVIFIKNEINLIELLCACDVAISAHSTGLLEAMILEVPIIQVNFSDKPALFDYSMFGDILFERDISSFIDTVNRLIHDESFRREVITKQNELLDKIVANIGCATDKIVKYIISLTYKKLQNK